MYRKPILDSSNIVFTERLSTISVGGLGFRIRVSSTDRVKAKVMVSKMLGSDEGYDDGR